MSATDWLILLHDAFIVLTCLALTIFLLSGAQDLFYDIAGYIWSLYKYIRFANRERLTMKSLLSREQQQIAVMVPAWQESEIIGKMVETILLRVKYRNYVVFVGTYPNDLATQAAVDAISASYPQVIKVVTARPGPTNKADNLNQVLSAIRLYEDSHDMQFDIVVMHDAEDLVHPYSFLFYNYLIPRAEIIQLPILPLPVSHFQWTHWVYADEFTENHMKDVIVREQAGGFVPFAGVGTGFSRRALEIMQLETGMSIFNEGSLTEDYSLSIKVHLHGLKSIFGRVVLADDPSPWYTPLSKRPGFIANWAYFPMDFTRSIRQKTRWIIGISLQEWEHHGWQGGLGIRENLIKDRKVFLAAFANVCGYLVLLYFFATAITMRFSGTMGLIPLIDDKSPYFPYLVATAALMGVRLVQRFILVTLVYGPLAGLLSAPRMIYSNLIGIIASYRAMHTFWQTKHGKAPVRWDKTDHQEGIGSIPSAPAEQHAHAHPVMGWQQALEDIHSNDSARTIRGLEGIPKDLPGEARQMLSVEFQRLCNSSDTHVRATLARVGGFLQWPVLEACVLRLLFDEEWIVRANAARAFLKLERFPELLNEVFSLHDRLAWEVLVRELEQNEQARKRLNSYWDAHPHTRVRDAIHKRSRMYRMEESRRSKGSRAESMVEQASPEQAEEVVISST